MKEKQFRPRLVESSLEVNDENDSHLNNFTALVK